jgi:hypothetical protein
MDAVMDVDTVARWKRTLPLIDGDDQVAVGQTDLDPVALRGWLYSATIAKLKSITPPLSHSLRRRQTSLLRLVLVYNVFRSLEATTADINISSPRLVAEPDRPLLFRPFFEEDERGVNLLPGPSAELRETNWSKKPTGQGHFQD